MDYCRCPHRHQSPPCISGSAHGQQPYHSDGRHLARLLMKQDGFTLIETLIALLIVSISFPALYRLEWTAMHEHSRLLDRTLALEAAQRRMEAWRGIATEAAYRQLASGQVQGKLDPTGTEVQQTWSVHSYTAPAYKTVELIISWRRDNNTNRIILSTIIANPVMIQTP